MGGEGEEKTKEKGRKVLGTTEAVVNEGGGGRGRVSGCRVNDLYLLSAPEALSPTYHSECAPGTPVTAAQLIWLQHVCVSCVFGVLQSRASKLRNHTPH